MWASERDRREGIAVWGRRQMEGGGIEIGVLVGEGEGCVTIATVWLAKCKQSAAVQGEKSACPQSVINLSPYSWCMSYIYTPTCKATHKESLSHPTAKHIATHLKIMSAFHGIFRWSWFYRPWLGPLFSCLSFLIGLLMAKAGEMKKCKMEVCTAGYTA